MGRRFQGRRWSGVFDAPGRVVLLACLGVALTLGFMAPSAAGSAPSFAAARNYAVGRGPISVAIGDLNGDGKPDLATANDGGTVSVLENRGGGGFQAGLDYRAPGKIPVAIAIGDLNGDGRRDLVTANRDSNTVSVLINTPGLCTVQDVEGETLAAAKRTIARAYCRLGKVRGAYSKWFRKGRVISETPKPLAVLGKGGKVNLVVSRGRKK
jgi:FG-GAP-like repeat